MRPSSPHFFPLAAPILLAFFFALLLLIASIEVGGISYAYEKIGIDRRYVFALLMASLAGSSVNIPIAELPAEPVMSGRVIEFFGMRYVVPMVENWPRTIVAVNVGGAVIPILVSLSFGRSRDVRWHLPHRNTGGAPGMRPASRFRRL